MSSRIEQQIDQIEEYIDNCKFQAFSKDKIIVDRDEIEELLEQLRAKTPEEIRHYQKIISNKEAILSDARKKAEDLINEAAQQTNQLINEHSIMQQAYTQANEVVELASKKAQQIINDAVNEANAYRSSAVEYMDGMLAQLENMTEQTMQQAAASNQHLLNSLGEYLTTVRQNRAELVQSDASEEVEDADVSRTEMIGRNTEEINLM